MKTRYVLGFTLLTAGVLIIWAFNNVRGAVATQSLMTMPTPAPTPTVGPFPTPVIGGRSALTTSQSLATSEQALARALQFDQMGSIWDIPWSADTLRLEPTRIAVSLFSSMTAESTDARRGDQLAPGADAVIGPVWRITIRGNVQPNIPSMAANSSTAIYDGLTYIVSQKTGALVAVITGKPVTGVAIPMPYPPPVSYP